jgi:hypothetical protein
MATVDENGLLNLRELSKKAWISRKKGLLQKSLEAYREIVKRFPDSIECGYATKQIENLKKEIAVFGETKEDRKNLSIIDWKGFITKKTKIVLIFCFLFLVVIPSIAMFIFIGERAFDIIALITVIFLAGLLYLPVVVLVSLARSGAPVPIPSFVGKVYSELKKGLREMLR